MTAHNLDDIDRALVRETQAGLDLTPRPYHAVAERLGIDAAEVMRRLAIMLEAGVIRRIGVVPNHFALGLDRNAMTVWDVSDNEVSRLGREIGALDFVTHCYRRPRALPHWPYNLFAMVHGRSDDEIAAKSRYLGKTGLCLPRQRRARLQAHPEEDRPAARGLRRSACFD